MQNELRQNKFRLSSIILALFVALGSIKAASVSLGWGANSDPNVVGYNVYYGTASGDYTSVVSVGNVSDVTISNLNAGTTYYFAATALDANGDESGFSDETIYAVPAISAGNSFSLSLGSNPGGPMELNIPVQSGHWYEVQASVDLQTWSTIYQTEVASSNGMVQFSDTNSSAFPSRFYRLVLH